MKKNLAVIFGGRSSEHEVSCVSVVTIAKAVDLEKYNMFLIGITKDGEWKLVEDIAGIEDGSWKESPVSAIISPDTKGGLIISQDDMMKVQPIDVIFPVLHGMYGEDGTIQGLFEMADPQKRLSYPGLLPGMHQLQHSPLQPSGTPDNQRLHRYHRFPLLPARLQDQIC